MTTSVPQVRTPETMPAPKGKTFTIGWQTSLGRFGWYKIVGCKDMDEALECFNASRFNGGTVPLDAKIDFIKFGIIRNDSNWERVSKENDSLQRPA